MPKRGAAYMRDQRDAILQATLDCMLDIGVAATSMRAIAQRAGVTTGAVYVHFESREEVIAAAAVSQVMIVLEPVSTWADFIRLIRSGIEDIETVPRYRAMQRAMYEFVADVDLASQSLPVWNGHADKLDACLRESLAAMQAAGEVTLPLGLETTVRVHGQLIAGAVYMLFAKPKAAATDIIEAAIAAITHVAGHGGAA